jgi:hypothetical protein
MCDINDIKRSLNKEDKVIELARQVKLIRELGEPACKFRIIDEMPMTPNMIDDFHLAIKTGVPGRPPKAKATTRPTIGDKYEIRWRYDLRSDVKGPKKLPGNRTRVFCTELIDANRYYSRQDINTMSNGFNLSVFEFAGGFWMQPDGSVSPQCRHQWLMVFVEKK